MSHPCRSLLLLLGRTSLASPHALRLEAAASQVLRPDRCLVTTDACVSERTSSLGEEQSIRGADPCISGRVQHSSTSGMASITDTAAMPGISSLGAAPAWRPASAFCRAFNTFSSNAMPHGKGKSKSDEARKGHRIEFSPISKAVALLVSQDMSKDRHRVVSSMSKLCLDMAADVKQYSPTEVAAFCEAAKKMDFCTQSLADAVMEYFLGRVHQLHEEELLGVIWVVAKKEDVDSRLAKELEEAVNAHLDDLRHEDLPDLLTLMASVCPASPFLLTAMAEEALSRVDDLSPSELTSLVLAFGNDVVRRSLFDDKYFRELARHTMQRAKEFPQPQLRSILDVFREVCPRRHSLVPVLAQLEAALKPHLAATRAN